MRLIRKCVRPMLLLLLLAGIKLQAQAGPPFQTDDPVPVDYGHYEFYVFGSADGTPVEMDSVGPAFEFNWGAVPRVQLHLILPFGDAAPLNHPAYAPAGQGPVTFGVTDMELGAKIAWFKEGKHLPQIGSFTMFELPTGNYSRGLGIGRVWYKLPLWAYKKIGPWGLDGGGGYSVIPQTGYHTYPYGGFLVERTINERLDFSVELFSHGAQGPAAPQYQSSTLIDAGGYYHFKSPGLQLLFAYGHSIVGQTENYAYLGLYKTWGKDKSSANNSAPGLLSSPTAP
ncbi:MAG TPA: transporter [Silvibacterium sp.]|nr:transporter [Silvibacterium sp.]